MNRLLCDVDGVLASWMGAVNDVIEQATGRRITPEDCGGWLKLSKLGLSKTEKEYVECELNAPGFVENLAPLPGALDGLSRVVAQTGCQLVIVTAQWNSETWLAERTRWLKKHGILKQGVGFVATREKYLVGPGLLVDDKYENVRDHNILSAGGHAVLWRTPYNAVDTRCSDLPTVTNWEQVTEELKKYAKNRR